jgi:carbonic anhydrase
MHPEAKQALATLLEGNARFVADRAACPPLTARRLEIARGQKPFAIVVSCSDSRVPVETVFDQIPGNIFGIRVAGNFVDDHGLGSIEYSVASFASSLILVLGHTECGAVKATVGYLKDGKPQPSHIQSLIEAIVPAAKESKSMPGDWVANATVQNVHDNIANLTARSPIVAGAVREGTLSIAGGIYDLQSGKVTIVK